VLAFDLQGVDFFHGGVLCGCGQGSGKRGGLAKVQT
jgi:hypothetical protein